MIMYRTGVVPGIHYCMSFNKRALYGSFIETYRVHILVTMIYFGFQYNDIHINGET